MSLLWLLFLADAAAASKTVCPSACDFDSLEAALDAASLDGAGISELRIGAGDYVGKTVSIYGSLKIVGAGKDKTRIGCGSGSGLKLSIRVISGGASLVVSDATVTQCASPILNANGTNYVSMSSVDIVSKTSGPVLSGSSVSFQDGSMTQATGVHAGLWLSSSFMSLQLRRSRLVGGSGTNGGQIAATAYYVIIEDNELIGGVANGKGGSLYWRAYTGYSSNLTVTGNRFCGSQTLGDGGAIYADATPSGNAVTLRDNVVIGSRATGVGGAFYALGKYADKPLTIMGNTVVGATAASGAGLVTAGSWGTFTLRNNLFLGAKGATLIDSGETATTSAWSHNAAYPLATVSGNHANLGPSTVTDDPTIFEPGPYDVDAPDFSDCDADLRPLPGSPLIDAGFLGTGYRPHIGALDPVSPEELDGDGDEHPWPLDCDDEDPDVYPGAVELCNGVDDDCDDAKDEGAADAFAFYRDVDEDGYGDADQEVKACVRPFGTVEDDGDCDDADPDVSPAATELCNGVDDDCDPGTREDDAIDARAWHPDVDGDGYGGASSVTACTAPSGHLEDGTDCDDAKASVHPKAAERCDGVDEDCDGLTDEGATDAPTWYADADGDGFGDRDAPYVACEADGRVGDATDCDDGDGAVHPGADEHCDGVDEDCDDLTDEGATDPRPWYADADGDGHGDPDASGLACELPSGASHADDDCDDADADVHPGATERCDGVDEDCDGEVDDGLATAPYYADGDGDGYGAGPAVHACEAPDGRVPADGDCDDAAAGVHPGAAERCDGVDEDCSGVADQGLPTTPWWPDGDVDSYGAEVAAVLSCGAPAGHVARTGDCDDADDRAFPGAPEPRNQLADLDCDGRLTHTGFGGGGGLGCRTAAAPSGAWLALAGLLGLRRRRWPVPLALCLAALGCEGPPVDSADTGSGGGDGDRSCRDVGPGGGEVSHAQAEVSLPPDAVGAVMEVCVGEGGAQPPDDAVPYGEVWSFGPSGATFSVPVTVTLPFAGDPALAVVFWSEDRETWAPIEGVVDGDRIAVTTTHFSWAFPGQNPGIRETFSVGPGPADLLLVVDDSGSMSEEQLRLAEGAGALLGPLAGVDFHVGVVTTDMDAPERGGRLVPTSAGARWVDATTAAAFPEIVVAGTDGSADERGLDAARAAYDQPENAGFFRDDASLGVVVLSDEEDYSTTVDPASFAAWMLGLGRPARFHAIIVPPGGCLEGGDHGARYAAVVDAVGGVEASLCADLAPALQTIGEQALAPQRRFTLQVAPNPASVAVEVDGVALDPSAFTVDGADLVLAAPPALGSEVAVRYLPAPTP